jgi:hypothetical protein
LRKHHFVSDEGEFRCLVVLGVGGIRQVIDDGRVRAGTTSGRSEDGLEVHGAVERQPTVGQDVNPVTLVVTGGVEDRDLHIQSQLLLHSPTLKSSPGTYIASLDEVARHEQVLLVRRDLDVVRADDGLLLIGVVEALDVVEVGDVQRGDVVAERQGEVGQLAVVGDVRVDGDAVLGLGAEVVQQLGDALLAAGVPTEGVDDPDLAEVNSAARS